VNGLIDDKAFQQLFSPWSQALGTLVPVGPGVRSRQPIRR
jgi:hypothetical protein